jgi:hypothetical protein
MLHRSLVVYTWRFLSYKILWNSSIGTSWIRRPVKADSYTLFKADWGMSRLYSKPYPEKDLDKYSMSN